jgi:hypothetical protein
MDTRLFVAEFRKTFPDTEVMEETDTFADPFPAVGGMTSPKIQRLLNLACSMLPLSEVYCEVGSYRGKTLISAAQGNPGVYCACDNFSQFAADPVAARSEMFANVAAHFPGDSVFVFCDADFRALFADWRYGGIGVYLYDGVHDTEGQRDGIAMAEPHLSDEALVLVDDWRFGEARDGTMSAVSASANSWELLAELPAKRNGSVRSWWNGFAVFAFRRRP